MIPHCQRPFWSSDDMNDSLIENWIDTVSPDDEVYNLGDVTMEGPFLKCFWNYWMRSDCNNQAKNRKNYTKSDYKTQKTYNK